ncbi:MAG: hypothetical protein ACRC78_25135 [Planktothrix sp.]
MIQEQKLLEKWRSLPQKKQQDVIDFVDFLTAKIIILNNPSLSDQSPLSSVATEQTETPKASSDLGIKLQKIREKIVDSGIPLLSAENVELEKAKRRG